MNIWNCMALCISSLSLLLGIYAIHLALKSEKIFNKIKESTEVFFEKENFLRGYDYHKESFKKFVIKPEDIEFINDFSVHFSQAGKMGKNSL